MDHYQYLYSQATHFNILMKHLSDEDSNSVKNLGMPKIQSVEQELIKKPYHFKAQVKKYLKNG